MKHCQKTNRVYTPRTERYHVRTIKKQEKNEINLLRTLEWYKVNYNKINDERTSWNGSTWSGWSPYREWA